MRCYAAIETLVRHAGWDGDVYLIHDGPNCFDLDKILQVSGLKRERLHLIERKVDEAPSLRGNKAADPSELATSAIDQVVEPLIMSASIAEWRIKSRLFEYITDPKIKILVSVNCDTLFALEGCAASLVAKAVEWKPTDAKVKITSLESKSTGNSTNFLK